MPESNHPRQQERMLLIKAVPSLIWYELKIPSKPLQNQIASSPAQSCCNSSENLPRSCHGARFPLGHTLLLGCPGGVPPYKEGGEGATEEHSPTWSRCLGRTVSRAHKSGTMYAAVFLYVIMPGSITDVGCTSCLCSAENLEPSHAPETAEKPRGVLKAWHCTLEMWLMTSISSFLSAA